MTRPPAISLRIVLGLLIAALTILPSGTRTPQPGALAATTPQAARSTLRVGMWTLWRDREVALTPGGQGQRTILRSCERCPAGTLAQPAKIRAEGDGVMLTIAGKKVNLDGVWLTGTITLTAHGESVTLQNPVTISARAGVLVISVTLPVESYVERVVASESGPADSRQSLQALAIVVRTFALHEPHGPAEYACTGAAIKPGNPPHTPQPWPHPARLFGSTASAPSPTSTKTAVDEPPRPPRYGRAPTQPHICSRCLIVIARAKGEATGPRTSPVPSCPRRWRPVELQRQAGSISPSSAGVSRAARSRCASIQRRSPPNRSGWPWDRRWDGIEFRAPGSR